MEFSLVRFRVIRIRCAYLIPDNILNKTFRKQCRRTTQEAAGLTGERNLSAISSKAGLIEYISQEWDIYSMNIFEASDICK